MKLNYLSSTIAIAALYLSGSLYAQKSDTLKEKTIEENKYKLKDMKTGNEQLVDISQMIKILKQ